MAFSTTWSQSTSFCFPNYSTPDIPCSTRTERPKQGQINTGRTSLFLHQSEGSLVAKSSSSKSEPGVCQGDTDTGCVGCRGAIKGRVNHKGGSLPLSTFFVMGWTLHYLQELTQPARPSGKRVDLHACWSSSPQSGKGQLSRSQGRWDHDWKGRMDVTGFHL